jgi:hypothetical protein
MAASPPRSHFCPRIRSGLTKKQANGFALASPPFPRFSLPYGFQEPVSKAKPPSAVAYASLANRTPTAMAGKREGRLQKAGKTKQTLQAPGRFYRKRFGYAPQACPLEGREK